MITMTKIMTDEEAIEAVRNGKRAVTKFTVSDARVALYKDSQHRCRHGWKIVACDSETDVIECIHCGKQRLVPCDFDDDCS